MKRLFLSFCLIILSAGVLAAQDTTNPLPGSKPPDWMSRHESFLEEAKKGGIDLLFLGDSITIGWRHRGSKVWDLHYGPRRAATFGIGGDRTQNLLWRIENGELDGLMPKVIVILIGTNNSRFDSADDIAAGIEKIVGVIRSKCPASKVLLLAVFPRNKPNDKTVQMERIRQVNARIAKLDDGRMIRFLDIGSRFLGPDGRVPVDIMPDGLHPNEKGYEIWADAMEGVLTEMLK